MDFNTLTKWCGVIGNPVEHSLSPAIHNAAFRHLGLNFVYLAFRVEDLAGAVQGIRTLGNARGFSVTIPHKVAIVPYLDQIDPTAKEIGSVNTILVDRHTLKGFNTDADGALRALREAGVELTKQRVLLLGSGGAARAIAFGLAMKAEIAGLTILGIDDRERQALVQDLQTRTRLSVEDGPINHETLQRGIKEAGLLIHGTPIGMHPKTEESCVPAALLRRHLTVMDIVYNPLETRLLREAREAGCRTISGIDMFLYQAVAQFELWTGRPAPIDVMRQVLESRFS